MLRDGRVLEIWGEAFSAVREEDRSIYALLQGGLLPEVEAVEEEGVPVEEVPLLAPIARPGKIVCIGLNYRTHAEEAGVDPPDTPTFFAKYANAIAAPGAEVALPSTSKKVDYEAEVAFVVGDRCKDVSEEEAMNHVAGYMLLNDLSARDLQFSTPAVDARQGLRRLGAMRARARHPRRGRAARRDRDRAEAERRGDAVGLHRRPDPFGACAGVPPLGPDDARPRRHRRHRHPLRAWAARASRGCGCKPGDEVVVSSPQLGELKTTIA